MTRPLSEPPEPLEPQPYERQDRSAAQPAPDQAPVAVATLIEADDLVEEITIDGMCGVY